MNINELVDNKEMDRKMFLFLEKFSKNDYTLTEIAKGLGVSCGLARNIIVYTSYRYPLYEYMLKGNVMYGFLEEGQKETKRDPDTVEPRQHGTRRKNKC